MVALKHILINPHHPMIFFLLITLSTISWQSILAVDYTITNNAATTPGGIIFTNQIGEDYAQQTLSDSTNFIWQTFQQNTDSSDRKPDNHVTLVVVPTLPPGIVAETGNDQIQFSAEYLAGYSGDVKNEFTGVIYHEMTHVWQWNGNNQAPSWLTEGIADYVRLKAGYPANGWAQPGGGNCYTDSYSITARFLDYCDSQIMGAGFVAQINRKMRDGYSDGFFEDLLGKSVDQLWSDYKAQYGQQVTGQCP